MRAGHSYKIRSMLATGVPESEIYHQFRWEYPEAEIAKFIAQFKAPAPSSDESPPVKKVAKKKVRKKRAKKKAVRKVVTQPSILPPEEEEGDVI